MGDVPTASWTVTQPWRGVFGMLVCLGIAFGITVAYNMDEFMGLFTAWAICIVPIEVVVGLTWGGKYPAEKFDNPWRGFLILILMFFVATIALVFVTRFIGGSGLMATVGPIHPLINVWVIGVVITTFFAVIAFGCWPFHKMSLPAKGFLTLLMVYLIWTAGFRFFNFDTITVPALEPLYGTTHIPAYVLGTYGPYHMPGIFGNLAGVNPSGPVSWDAGLTFFFGMVIYLFVFVHLGMWPFTKFKSLMKQPNLGIALLISCFALGLITHAIGVWAMDIDPIRMMLHYVCYAFGMLSIIFMWQMWPGRLWKGPTGGFINLLIAVVLAVVAFYGIQAFCQMAFGHEWFVQVGHGVLFAGPNGWFAMANVMLALTFPAWALYGPVFDFWPLPPTPAPPPH